MVIRKAKIMMLFSISIFFFLVVLNNILDYENDFAYVQHVLSMDTTLKSPTLMHRSVHNTLIHHFIYWCIITWQAMAGILCFICTLKLAKYRSSSSIMFNNAKGIGIIGLICGFLLYSFAFITIGGELFVMWQSEIWNVLRSSHMFMSMLGIVLIFLVNKDE